MITIRLMIGAVLLVIVSACTSAGERRVDTEPDIAAGSPLSGTPNALDAASAAQLSDRDGDLVFDANDRCQDSVPGSAVDTNGCSVFSGAIQDLEFAPDGDNLNTMAKQALDALITKLNDYPDVVIAVDGHTDNRGLASSNLDLSKRRVIAVVRYLVEQGVPASRLKPYGYGESRPMQSNATAEGRRSNRRIEVRQVRA